MSPTSRRLSRLQHECEVSPLPALLPAAACALLCLWLLAQLGSKPSWADHLVQESASRLPAADATEPGSGGDFDAGRVADEQPAPRL